MREASSLLHKVLCAIFTLVILPRAEVVAIYETTQTLQEGTISSNTSLPQSQQRRRSQTIGRVVRFRVVSADRNRANNGERLLDPLNNGGVIDLSEFSVNQTINIEALVGNGTGPVGSMRLTLQRGGTTIETTDEVNPPYAICGDSNGVFKVCTTLVPSTLRYNLTATTYSLPDAKGTTGRPLSISFTIKGKATPPVAPPKQTPVSPPKAAPVATPKAAPVAPPKAAPVAPPKQPPVPAPPSRPAAWIEVDNNAPLDVRHEACFVMVDRKAYLLAGRSRKRVDIYDPITRTWDTGREPPIQIHHTQCVAVGTSIWIVSSWTGGYPRETATSFIYIYDTVRDVWSTKPGLPENRRRGGAAAVLSGNRIYVSHGNRGGHETGDHATTLGWLDYFDIEEDLWVTNLPDAPNPRDHTGGALVDGRICIAGGRDGGSRDFFDLTILPTDCYDPRTNRWTVEANIPQGRAGSSYGRTCDGKLMVAGGEGYGTAWANVDVFDGRSWTSIDSLNIPRHGSGLAVDCICNQIHLAGGARTQGGRFEITSVETLFPNGVNVPCRA